MKPFEIIMLNTYIVLCLLSLAGCESTTEQKEAQYTVITQGAAMVPEYREKFAIAQGCVERNGYSGQFMNRGIIYGKYPDSLEIESFNYKFGSPNHLFGCVQSYLYTAVSKEVTVMNICIDRTLWKDNGLIYGYEFSESDCSAPGEYSCPMVDLDLHTTYYYRAFVHIFDEDNNHIKYLYGEVKTLETGASTQDPSVFYPISSLHIGVMKNDLYNSNLSTCFRAYQACSQFNWDGGIGGYRDWRLPNLEELREIYKHRSQIGGFRDAWYASDSTREDISPFYYYWDFSSNAPGLEETIGYSRQTVYARLVRDID